MLTYCAGSLCQTRCGPGPLCCSSSAAAWTGAGTPWSTLWLHRWWTASDLGASGRAASACSPNRECCHKSLWHPERQCTCRHTTSTLRTKCEFKGRSHTFEIFPSGFGFIPSYVDLLWKLSSFSKFEKIDCSELFYFSIPHQIKSYFCVKMYITLCLHHSSQHCTFHAYQLVYFKGVTVSDAVPKDWDKVLLTSTVLNHQYLHMPMGQVVPNSWRNYRKKFTKVFFRQEKLFYCILLVNQGKQPKL